MQQKSVKELIFDLSSDIEEVRKVAIIWLAQVGDDGVLPDLRRMTQDPSTAIRYFARRAIDTIEKRVRGSSGPSLPASPQSRSQVEDWRARLAQDEVSGRLATAQALQKVEETQARPLARERLPVESDPAVKAALLALLAVFKNEADLDLIFGQLAEPDHSVRAEAVLALESFYHPSIRDRLLPMVRDPDNRTRANVLLVLGRYDADLIAGPLAEMATSREIWNKDSALWVLRRLRTPRAVELLGRMHAENRSDGYLFPKVDAALRELAAKGDEAAVKVLGSLEAGRFEKTEGKLELDRVLDDIESEADEGETREKRTRRVAIKSVEEFEISLGDGDYERRLSAVDAGVTLDPIAAAMAFRTRLATEQHPFVISKLIKELGRVGGPADVDLIAGQLGHPDARVRANAIEGLALLGGEHLYERIKPLMDDPAPRVQATAARVVYSIDRDRAFRKLKAMIASRENAVSDAAIHALGDVHADDVLELLELALGQDDQELRLRIFRVLQRLSTKSPVAAQIYARYREEGDGVLIKAADLQQTVGVAADPTGEGRLQAIEVLRRSPDERAKSALEKLARDRDPRVKRAAMAALRVRELELERGVMLYQLGSALYRSWKRGELANPELDLAFGIVEKHGQELDQGLDPVAVLTQRGLAMAEAGRRSLDLVNDFAIKHRARAPRAEDGGKSEELSVDALPALAARIGQVDRKIEERLLALDNAMAVSPGAPVPPVHGGDRTVSGKVAQPVPPPSAPPARAPGHATTAVLAAIPLPDDADSRASTPKDGIPIAALPAATAGPPPPSRAPAASTSHVPAANVASEEDLPPLRSAVSGAIPAPASEASVGAGRSLASIPGSPASGEPPNVGPRTRMSKAMRPPSASLSALVDPTAVAPADGGLVLLRVWLQQNPALGAIGGALALVMMLVVIGSSMGGDTFKGAWKRPVKDPARLVAAGEAVLALSRTGVLTSLSLASGKVDWQYSGPTLEGGFPPRVDAGHAFLSGSDGRIIAVNLRTGKKAWEVTLGPLVSAPTPAGGKLLALVSEPPAVVLLDARTGQKGPSFATGPDVHAAVPALGGVVLVRTKGLTLMEPLLTKAQWDLVLPAETAPGAVPFEVAGNLIVLASDLLLCLSKDGNKVWERRVEPGAMVMPGALGRKEIFVVAKKFVEVVDSTGKGGATASMGAAWSTVEIGKTDVLFADAEGSLYLLDLRDKTQRKVLDFKEPVRAIARVGNIGVAAAAARIEAFSLQPPRS